MGTILLVRHGQASFGADDYDQLSALGYDQARDVGAALGERGLVPSLIVSGGLKRQQQTAASMVEAAGWATELVTDPNWDEFDHIGMVGGGHGPEVRTDPRAFQDALEVGMREWAAGADGPETFAGFGRRTAAGLASVAEQLGSGETAIVVSSAGVIARVCCELLGVAGDAWVSLNRVAFNTGITTLATGRSGVSLLTFNDPGHLEPKARTFR
jgi:broad specificity phosphatase PhoE